MHAEPGPPGTKFGRQFPGEPHRLIVAELAGPRRDQSHHVIQRHTYITTRQRHHIMRALHDPRRKLTRPIHQPSPLDLSTKIRLRPVGHASCPWNRLRPHDASRTR